MPCEANVWPAPSLSFSITITLYPARLSVLAIQRPATPPPKTIMSYSRTMTIAQRAKHPTRADVESACDGRRIDQRTRRDRAADMGEVAFLPATGGPLWPCRPSPLPQRAQPRNLAGRAQV